MPFQRRCRGPSHEIVERIRVPIEAVRCLRQARSSAALVMRTREPVQHDPLVIHGRMDVEMPAIIRHVILLEAFSTPPQ